MILPVFSIYDSKAAHYSAPHVQLNEHVAVRAFVQAATTPGNSIFQNPEDFSLIEIGHFDDQKGVLTATDHINHGLASTYINQG